MGRGHFVGYDSDGSFFKVKKSDVVPPDTDHSAYCEYCDKEFRAESEAVSHKEDAHHYCRECDRLFRNGIQQQDHFDTAAIHAYRDQKEGAAKVVDRTGYCSYCDRRFKTHSESVSHKEDLHEYCTECDLLFPTGKEQQNHFKTDAIHVYQSLVAAKKAARAADVKASPLAVSKPPLPVASVFTHFIVDAPQPSLTPYRATERSRSHSGMYPCVFCDTRSYARLSQLQQHLESKVHARPEGWFFKCPTCGVWKEVFSELVRHAERDGCGVIPRTRVDEQLEGLTTGMQRLGR